MIRAPPPTQPAQSTHGYALAFKAHVKPTCTATNCGCKRLTPRGGPLHLPMYHLQSSTQKWLRLTLFSQIIIRSVSRILTAKLASFVIKSMRNPACAQLKSQAQLSIIGTTLNAAIKADPNHKKVCVYVGTTNALPHSRILYNQPLRAHECEIFILHSGC
jgi:hypothetical protein